jgi:cobalamin biosynthetic protein CobC
MTKAKPRDHGGGLDGAIASYGGTRSEWLDLSTGINPVPYPLGDVTPDAWTALPDHTAAARLERAARKFWNVPDDVKIIAAPGASALIARMPQLGVHLRYHIDTPTYNEHAAAFDAAGIARSNDPKDGAATHIFVHPNNPDGRDRRTDIAKTRGMLTIVDESFCDISPELSVIGDVLDKRMLVMKSFGKFWGLAGLRLGFAIARADVFEPSTRLRLEDGTHRTEHFATLSDLLGPWPVAGPALEIAARALEDEPWAIATRARLDGDAARMDALMTKAGASVAGGTSLFRLYDAGDAAAWQDKLARAHIWSRIFPYSTRWLRLGLPAPDQWDRLEAALS